MRSLDACKNEEKSYDSWHYLCLRTIVRVSMHYQVREYQLRKFYKMARRLQAILTLGDTMNMKVKQTFLEIYSNNINTRSADISIQS